MKLLRCKSHSWQAWVGDLRCYTKRTWQENLPSYRNAEGRRGSFQSGTKVAEVGSMPNPGRGTHTPLKTITQVSLHLGLSADAYTYIRSMTMRLPYLRISSSKKNVSIRIIQSQIAAVFRYIAVSFPVFFGTLPIPNEIIRLRSRFFFGSDNVF